MRFCKNYIAAITFTCFLMACRKTGLHSEISDRLPPVTQTGANTFGCIINDNIWVAQSDCNYLCDPAFKIYYDAASGGSLSIIARRESSFKGFNQSFVISFDSANFKSFHSFQNNLHLKFSFHDYMRVNNSCGDMSSLDFPLVSTSGSVTLTKYDLQAGIIAGLFDFSLSKSGCETIAVTSGRFDYKLF